MSLTGRWSHDWGGVLPDEGDAAWSLCVLSPGHTGFQISIPIKTLHGSVVKFLSHSLESFFQPGFSFCSHNTCSEYLNTEVQGRTGAAQPRLSRSLLKIVSFLSSSTCNMKSSCCSVSVPRTEHFPGTSLLSADVVCNFGLSSIFLKKI